MTTAPLADVCEIVMGQAPKGDTYNTDGVGLPLIAGAGDFGDLHPSVTKFTTARGVRTCRSGDIVLSIRASVGAKVLADGEYCLGRGVAGLRAGRDLDDRYLWHWTTAAAPALAAKGRGATFLQVNKTDISELEIPLPPIEEQRRIAAVLDAADVLRARRRHGLRRVRDLEDSVFADFMRSHAGGPTAPLGDVAERVTVGHVGPTSEHFADEGVPFIRTGNVGDGVIIRDGLRAVTPAFHATLAKSTLRDGDLLISRVISDQVRAAVVPADLDGANCANVIIVRPGQRTSANFLLGLLRLGRSQTSLLGRRVGSAQSVVNTGVVREWHVPLPSRAALEALDQTYVRLRSLEALQLASLESFTALSASLQQRAFRGEL